MFWLIKVILGKSLQKNFNSFGGEKFLGMFVSIDLLTSRYNKKIQ